MHNALNLLDFTSKLCFELFLVLPLKKDDLSTMDKQLVPKVSSLGKFHCNYCICYFLQGNILIIAISPIVIRTVDMLKICLAKYILCSTQIQLPISS